MAFPGYDVSKNSRLRLEQGTGPAFSDGADILVGAQSFKTLGEAVNASATPVTNISFNGTSFANDVSGIAATVVDTQRRVSTLEANQSGISSELSSLQDLIFDIGNSGVDLELRSVVSGLAPIIYETQAATSALVPNFSGLQSQVDYVQGVTTDLANSGVDLQARDLISGVAAVAISTQKNNTILTANYSGLSALTVTTQHTTSSFADNVAVLNTVTTGLTAQTGVLTRNFSGLDVRTQSMQAANQVGIDTAARGSCSGLDARTISMQADIRSLSAGGTDLIARSSISGLDSRTVFVQGQINSLAAADAEIQEKLFVDGTSGTASSSGSIRSSVLVEKLGTAATAAKGEGSIDLQVDRSLASQAATGSFSVITGGQYNTASGAHSIVGGGWGNTASNVRTTVCGGGGNIASDTYCSALAGEANYATNQYATICGGSQNHAYGARSFVGGGFNNSALGTYSNILGGYYNTASGDYSSAAGHGSQATLHGEAAFAGGYFTVVGDAQLSQVVLRNATTDNTPTELFLDGASARLALTTYTTLAFSIDVVARKTGTNDKYAYFTLTGIITKEANNASTLILGTVTSTVIYRTSASWSADATADTANGALKITVTGEAATNILWVASARLTKVMGQ